MDTSGMLSSPLGNEDQIVQVPNYPSQKLDDQMIRFSRIS